MQRIQYRRKSGIPGRPLPSCIRKNPGTRAGFCFAAYTVYAKIQEPRQGPAQQRIRENPEARGGICSVAYTQNPGAGQGSAQQRIRKNPGTRAGFCSVAYTVYAKIQEPRQAPVRQRIRKIQEPGEAPAQQRIRENPEAQAGPDSVYLCESASITKKPGRVDLLPGFLW